MAELDLTNIAQASIATPASGVTAVYASNLTPPQIQRTDAAGIAVPMFGSWFTSNPSNFTGTDVNTAQPVFNTTEDVVTVPASTSWLFEGQYHIHTTGTTSHTLGILFGGTATLTSIGYQAHSTNAATEVLGADSSIWSAVATVTVVSAALASATHHNVLLKGIVRFNAGGTFIPQYQWSAAPGVAGITLANSYFKMTLVGNDTLAASGPWA